MEKWRKEGAGPQFFLPPQRFCPVQEQFEIQFRAQDLQMGVIQICSLAQTHICGLTCIYTIKCYLLASFKVQGKTQTCSWAQGKDEWCVMRFPPSLFFTIWAGKADPERAGEDGSYFVVYPKCAPGMFLRVILGWLWMDTLGLWQDFCPINWGFGDLPDLWNDPAPYCISTLLILAFILVCVLPHKIDVQKAKSLQFPQNSHIYFIILMQIPGTARLVEYWRWVMYSKPGFQHFSEAVIA